MNLQHLNLFIRIAATQNISEAGAELGLSPAVASAQLRKLEASLGIRLVHRTTRKVSLTEDGIAFLHHAENVLESVEAAKASVGAGSVSPSGVLRVTAPASFGRMHVLPALKGLLDQYPKLSVDLKLSDSIVDLVEGGFDVAIRNSALEDSSLVARKLAPDRRILCAAPEYLAQFGKPEYPSELMHHNCITLMGLDAWSFQSDNGQITIKVNGNFRTDNGEAVRDACAEGLGITVNSTWSAYQQIMSGALEEVLPAFPLASQTAIWVVYPSSRQLAPKVRAFIDYYATYFEGTPYWEKALSEASADT